jgi:asparagine synthetase B (glutamine-hydrolysing)
MCFAPAGDTEVVMAAYRRWGTSCFEQFNGMWAIRIVDLERKVVVGSRDRIGSRPLAAQPYLYRETRHTNVPALLMYSDRNAMAHLVETRFPYFDHRIVELWFCFGLRKRLLHTVAKEYLPKCVRAGTSGAS